MKASRDKAFAPVTITLQNEAELTAMTSLAFRPDSVVEGLDNLGYGWGFTATRGEIKDTLRALNNALSKV